MRIVIDIPEKDYEKIKKAHWFEGHDTILDRMYLAIKHGTRLPENHGRLIDADALQKFANEQEEKYGISAIDIDEQPTVVEGVHTRT